MYNSNNYKALEQFFFRKKKKKGENGPLCALGLQLENCHKWLFWYKGNYIIVMFKICSLKEK